MEHSIEIQVPRIWSNMGVRRRGAVAIEDDDEWVVIPETVELAIK
jgi:hypothetical protein